MTLIIIVNTRMSMSVVPLLRSLRDKGVTFVLSHTKLARDRETCLLSRIEDLARVSIAFDLDQVEVKVDSSGSVAGMCRKLRALDPAVRMEVFSLTSEQEYDQLADRQHSNRAILISKFCRPWTESELVRHLSSFGPLEELHSYHCRSGAERQQVLVVFKTSDARNSCFDAALLHKWFSTQNFESVNLECDDLNAFSKLSCKSQTSRSVSPSMIPGVSAGLVSRSYYSYNYSKTRLQRLQNKQLIASHGLTERLKRSKQKEAVSTSTINRLDNLPRSISASCRRPVLLEGQDKEDSGRSKSCSKVADSECQLDIVARSLCPFDTADLDRSFLSFNSIDDRLFQSRQQRLASRQNTARMTGKGGPRPSLPRCFDQSSPAVPHLELYSGSLGGQDSFGCRQAERQNANMFYTQPHIPYFAFPNELITQSHSQA